MCGLPTKFAILIVFVFSVIICAGQSVNIQKNIQLPKDTIVKNQLINSLNGLLSNKELLINQNEFVKENSIETAIILYEMKSISESVRFKNKNFYKCYLTNIVKQNDDNYVIQLSYIGVDENEPVLRASFRLIANLNNGHFNFSSPLKQNTALWKAHKVNNITFHYKNFLNKDDTKLYLKTVQYYNGKIKAPVVPVDFYYCDNFTEAQQLVGIDYKSDYNSVGVDDLGIFDTTGGVLVSGGSNYPHHFDPHGVWHERLRTAMKNEVINYPVDEGCAYLYGGCWGYIWQEIIIKFKKFANDNPNADWLNLYIDSKNFEEGAKYLSIPFVLNALIIQKIEKEKGFSPVKELLACGKHEKGDENYFKALEKVSGISKASFNTTMGELIKSSK